VKANVRVIAATHQNLEQRVKEGGFREDLFHRLNVIRLRLPALRERREDVPVLTRYFLQQSAKQLDVEPKRISDGALRALSSFDFPGNVRQLENICHWLTVMAPAQMIEVKDMPPEVLAGVQEAEAEAGRRVALASMPAPAAWTEPVAPAATTVSAVYAMPTSSAPLPEDGVAPAVAVALPPAMGASSADWEQGLQAEAHALLADGRPDVWDVLTRRFETRLIQTALASTRGRRIEAAQKLGIGRNTITRKIQELHLE
jgi:two-component system nitrogen regulation response regulator GlnG